jgi:hypothetical protein
MQWLVYGLFQVEILDFVVFWADFGESRVKIYKPKHQPADPDDFDPDDYGDDQEDDGEDVEMPDYLGEDDEN